MEFLLTFLEGIISFVSPCVLPLLPVYISYFAGDNDPDHEDLTATLSRAVAFVAGFTVVFSLLGVFAGSLSRVMTGHQQAVNIICGGMIVFFGLTYLNIIKLPEIGLKGGAPEKASIPKAFIFGMIYSVTLAPCASAFLGSALMLAGTSGTAFKGSLLLVSYSLGFGLPFIFSAVLIKRLESAFDLIKKHYSVINTCSGLFLIGIGILMMTGYLGKWMALLS